MRRLLITGTDTSVGKTWISCLLLRQLRAEGFQVGAYKPVCSGAVAGADGSVVWEDVQQLSEAICWTGSLDQICPQRFRSPVSPNLSAVQEGRRVDEDLLVRGLDVWEGMANAVIIEGAGGLLCPVSETFTMAELAAEFRAPLLVVAANRLGVINHTLLTTEVAVSRGLRVSAVILNDVAERLAGSDVSLTSNHRQLQDRLGSIPVFRCEYLGDRLLPTVDGRPFSTERLW